MRPCARLALLLPLATACGQGFEEPAPFEPHELSELSADDVDASQNADSIDSADTPLPSAPLNGCNIDAGHSFEVKRFETGGSTSSIRVVGIYQAGIRTDGQAGEFSLNISEPGRFALILTAHEAVRWNISVGPDTEVTQVIATGYHRQQVAAGPNSNIKTVAHDDGERVLSGVSRWPDLDRQCEDDMPATFCTDFGEVWKQDIRRAHHALGEMAEELQLPISGFYGCHDMNSLNMAL